MVKIGQGLYSVECSQGSDDGQTEWQNDWLTDRPVKNIIPSATTLHGVKLNNTKLLWVFSYLGNDYNGVF